MRVLRTAIDHLGKGIVITDLAGTIRYVNPAFTAMSGYSADEVLGANPRLVNSGQQGLDFYREFWATIQSGRVWRGELINRRKDGLLYTEEMTVAPMFDAAGVTTGYTAIKEDISQRRLDQQARSYLAQIVENSSDAIVTISADGIIQSWNHSARKLYGYDAAEAIGKPIAMMIPAREWGKLHSTIVRLAQGENIAPFEGLALRKDGVQIPIGLSVTPRHGGDSRLISVAAIIRDISVQRREQEARNLLASIVESSDDAIFARSLDGIILSWNKSAERLYGYTALEAIGRPATLMMSAEHFAENEAFLAKIKAGQSVSHFETVRTRKDGRHIDVSLTISPIRNSEGEVIGGATVAHDMTEQKRTQEELRQSEEKYRQLVTNIPDIIWTADEEARPVFITPNVESLLGYTPEELYNNSVWFDRIHPDDAPAVAQAYQTFLATNEMFSSAYRVQRKDGVWIWAEGKAISTFQKSGKRFIVGITADVTTRKQAEEQLRNAKDMADVANRAKSEFLANISHELRTPLNGIVGFTALLLESELDSQKREYLEMVQASAESLLRIINDVLDFSKIEARKLSIDHHPFELTPLMQTVVRSLEPRARGKSLTLEWRIDPDVPLVLVGDLGRLRQTLTNLIENAIKFTERGSVLVSVHQALVLNDSIELHFSVSDTGIGISADKQSEIFEAFVQVDMSSTRRFGGVGLGLAVASGLVRLMAGRIWVSSEPGKGSTFHFTASFDRPVPLAPKEQKPQPRLVKPSHMHVPTSHQVITRDDMRDRIRLWLDRLPPFPAVLHHLLATISMGADDICLKGLAELVQTDALIAGKVVGIANSTFYSRGQTVCSVHQAVVRLGVQRLRNTLLSLSINRVWGGLVIHDDFSILRFNQHALATAILADLLGQRLGIKNADAAFVTGLFHDVGQLVLVSLFPDEYLGLLQEIADGPALEWRERELLTFSHADVSAEATAHWSLPRYVQMAVRSHERPVDEENTQSLHEFTLRDVLHVADACATGFGMSVMDIRSDDDAVQTALAPLAINESEIVEAFMQQMSVFDECERQTYARHLTD